MAGQSWSKNTASTGGASSSGYTKTTTTAPSKTTTTSYGGSNSNTSETIDITRMTPESQAALENLIKALQGGGTNEQRAAAAKRQQALQLVQGLLDNVSTGQAFTDAEALMSLELQRAAERNLPAIQRAIEGAGTSASSMQAVLAQQAQRDAALAAGALGAQQAQVYAQQRTGLANTLEALTRQDDPVTRALVNALSISKGAVEHSTRNATASSSNFSNSVTHNPGSTTTETFVPDNPTSGGVSGASVKTDLAPVGAYDYSSYLWKPIQGSLYDWFEQNY